MKKHYKLLIGLVLGVNVGLAYAGEDDECSIYENTATVPAHAHDFRVDWGNNGNHSNSLDLKTSSNDEFICNGSGSLTDWVPMILVENASKSLEPNPDVTVSSYLNNGFGGYWLMDSANLANQDSHYESSYHDFMLYNRSQTGTSYYYVIYADNNTDKDVSIHYTVCNYYPTAFGAAAHWNCGNKGNRPM